jgi:Predicted membrane protein (DUF2207) N-terminal domain
MGTRRRRRVDAALLAAAVVLVGAAAFAAGVAARTERISRLWAGAAVGGDGAARVAEVIDYDFGSQRRHGIFRDVPGLDPAGPVQVSSATAPDQVEVTGTAQQGRIRIGDPDRTVSGRHRYTIAYRLPVVARGGRLAWDAVGTAWPGGIAGVELHVVAPWRLDGVRCVRGVAGSEDPGRVAQPEPGHLVATADGLDAGEGVTLFATTGPRLAAAPALPAPPAGVPPDPGTGPLPPALVAVAAVLAGAVPASWLVRRAGRERVAPGGAAEAAFGSAGETRVEGVERIDAADLARLATVEFVPPRELTAAQGGVLLAEAVRPEHKVAWLIGAAVDGYLDLEGDDGEVTLVRLPRRDGPATYLLDSAFEGRDRLTLGSYDEDFATAWRSLGRELTAWERSSGLWDPAGDHRRARTPGPRGRRRGRRAGPDRPSRRLGQPLRARLAGPGRGGRAAGRGGRGRGRARLGAAGPDARRVRPVAADRVVPAVPGRLRGPPRRGGGQARPPARVHRLGGGRGRAGPVVAGRGRLVGGRHRRGRGPLPGAGPDAADGLVGVQRAGILRRVGWLRRRGGGAAPVAEAAGRGDPRLRDCPR